MSSLIVEVCAVEEIAPHPQADRLERSRVKNWWCVTGKGQFSLGQKVVYVPPDAVLPEALAERWGIAKYCVPLGRDISGQRPPGLRVRACRLRGVASFGTLQLPDDAGWAVGTDVRERYGITKYEPPVRAQDGDSAPPVANFPQYTDIESIGNFPGVFQDGEDVLVTEKIHGTSSRVGYVFHEGEWQWMAGSHHNRRKEFNDRGVRSKYWFPLKPPDVPDSVRDTVRELILDVKARQNARSAVVVYGEIFGPSVQDMTYGQTGLAFRVFDVAVDGNYLSANLLLGLLAIHGVDMVPVLYRGPFSMAKMEELVDGPTLVCEASAIKEPFKGREGCVVKSATERHDAILGGRAILKYVSADYHDRKNKNRTDDH